VHAEHAAEIADVLAVDDHVVVAFQHDVHGRAQGLDHGHRRGLGRLRISCQYRRITSHPQLLALAAQVFGHVFVDVLEHRRGARHAAIGQRAELFGFLLRGQDFGFQFGLHCSCSASDQAPILRSGAAQAGDRVAQREVVQSSAGR
jgi:hypothetical protein